MNKPILGTNVVTQIGILVHDIDKTSAEYAKFLGVDVPQWTETDIEEKAQTKYMGQPSQARAKLAFFDIGENLNLELIQPDHNPSTWRHDLDKNGEGFHHIAFVIKGMKEKIAVLKANGMQLLQTGEYEGGRYAYMDANDSLKLVMELLEND
ncbi:MAG: VOC family protein [Christensenellales bacterium]|jgi:methylmalonyl-CoA/ethylmalonyl-CoA epimerase|nr:VOC family protein [Clostridiales bacterium]